MIVAVVPAMNEPLIGRLVARVLPHVDECIVVTDFDPETDALAVAAGAKALWQETPGLAGAIATGVDYSGLGDTVVTLDGDGAQNPAQIPRLLACDADVVVGSRFLPGSRDASARTLRWWESRAFSFACQLRSGVKVRDWGGGFRAYRDGAAHALFPTKARGHAYQAEVLHAAAAELGMSIAEVPVDYLPTASTLSRSAVAEGLRTLASLSRGGFAS